MPPKKQLILPPEPECEVAKVRVETTEVLKQKAKPKKLILPKDHVLGIESTEEPIVPSVIKQVRLTRFSHDGKYYYRNCENDSLYEYLGSHKRGCYMGRWDSVQERIVRDAPESDSEL